MDFRLGRMQPGAQWDGLMFEGSKVDLNWDNQWTSVVKNYDDKWIFEAAIPFKTIRFKEGIDTWGINFSRLDLKDYRKIELDTGAQTVSNCIACL
jgi:hypothetical protein